MSQLARNVSLGDAFAIGVASMIGAGVFAVWGPAATAAGGWLLVGLALAALVAWCNATSSAQLAAQYPSAGGTYVYGRQRLGPWPGYLAGWCFIVGKLASAGAMAMVFSAYWVPEPATKWVSVGLIWVLVTINILGVTRTAAAAKALVSVALLGIAIALITGWSQPSHAATLHGVQATPYGVLQSAGLLFFAFAGYARIATMGEEVVHPERNIRRAILMALAVTLVVYLLVGVTLLTNVGATSIAGHPAPLMLLVGEHNLARIILVVGACAASAGALLGLLTGIGRTSLAMARTQDLPGWLNRIGQRTQTPYRIEIVVGVVVSVLVLTADLRGAIGFSSFGVLLYYFVANLAAWTQTDEHRRYRKVWQLLGMMLCIVLVVTLPWQSVVAGLVVVAVGVLWRIAFSGMRGTKERNVH